MSPNPIRINTMIGTIKVSTFWAERKWYTVVYGNDTSTVEAEATDLFEAGENHLRLAKQYAAR